MDVLFFYLLIGVFNGSVIIGVYKLTSKNHLFYFIRLFFESIIYRDYSIEKISYTLEFLYRPILGCIICMNSFWGLLMFRLYMYLEVLSLIEINMKSLVSYLLSILVSVTITSFYEINIQHNKQDSIQAL